MQILGTVACSNCGVALPVEIDAHETTCLYCSATTPIAEEAVNRHRNLPASISEAEAEGLGAMRDALEYDVVPSGLVVLALVFLPGVIGFGLTAPMIFMAQRYFVDYETVTIVLAVLLPMGLFIGGFYVPIPYISLAFMGKRVNASVDRLLERLRSAVGREPEPGKCPVCGGPTQVPIAQTTMTCLFCDATLLASQGMLIKWEADASIRSDAWKKQATTLIERHRANLDFSPALALGSFFLVATMLCFGWLGLTVGGMFAWESAYLAANPDAVQEAQHRRSELEAEREEVRRQEAIGLE